MCIRDRPNSGLILGTSPVTGINSPITQYSHGLGFSNPNATYNVGADITLTPKIVATTRFGYFFNNYHDSGWPTTGVDLSWQTTGQANQGAFQNCMPVGNPPSCTPSVALPAALQLPVNTSTDPFDQQFTEVNASKHYQFNQDVAFFKSGWFGTHNIKGGYQFNKLSNVINQHGNVPLVDLYLGAGNDHSNQNTLNGVNNCGTLSSEWGGCAGEYGYVIINDFATVLKNSSGALVPATDQNHALDVYKRQADCRAQSKIPAALWSPKHRWYSPAPHSEARKASTPTAAATTASPTCHRARTPSWSRPRGSPN